MVEYPLNDGPVSNRGSFFNAEGAENAEVKKNAKKSMLVFGKSIVKQASDAVENRVYLPFIDFFI